MKLFLQKKQRIILYSLILFLITIIITPLSAQIQLGNNINGEAERDESGYSVSISANGSRVAVGAPKNDENGTDSGHVRVYELTNGSWTKLGQDINGDSAYDHFGHSVSLSSDGTRVAIGAPNNNNYLGHVKIYEWNGVNWMQLGLDIVGEAENDFSGQSVSLSADGIRVAIGAHMNDGNGTKSGHVRVYEWDGIDWTQLGTDIDGEAAYDESGYSVSLSSDGVRLAIGALFNDGNGNKSGHIRIYEWGGANWIQLGTDIDGESASDFSGYSVSLSANGMRMASGTPYNWGSGGPGGSGHVRIFEWNSSVWEQLGADIDGEPGNSYGHSVSLSSDGSRVLVGDPTSNANGNNSGHAQVLEWDGVNWIQQGVDINGINAYDNAGNSVAISSDGERVLIGAYYSDANGNGSGQVRVFDYTPLPIRLIDFRGYIEGKCTYLIWDTALEIDNYGFEIEYSKDSKLWNKVGFIKGKGTGEVNNKYNFVHANPNSGINYYRLKQLDFYESFEYSKIISVNNKSFKQIKLFPNPTNGKIKITGIDSEFCNVEIVDIFGRKIWEEKLTNQEVDISSLANGQYFVTIKLNNKIVVKRVVKN